MGIVVITVAAVLCAAAVLFIPFTYHVSIRTGRPFRLCIRAGWFGRALAGTWDYTWGQRPVSSVYIGWKRQAGPPPDLSEDTSEKGADQAAEAVRQQAETDSAVTYESLKQEDDSGAPKTAGFHWKPLVFNRDFAAAFFCWLGRILHHSRVRSLDIRGVIGLGQPHETGLLAGALYAVVPDAIGGLRFDYLEERYDSTIRGSGTLYPAALLWYSALFIASRPVRRLIAGWHASKRGEHHGQHDKKQSGNDLQ